MDLRVLGALTLDDGRIALAPRDRLVLGALAVRIGRAVTVESIATAVWGDALPASWSKVIPGCIMRLRRRMPTAAIETTPAGYALAPAAVDLDAARFERLVERGSRLLELNEPDRAAHSLSEALGLWRGEPFAELQNWAPACIEADRLDEIRLAAEESLLEARLQSGDLVDAAAEARARVAESPMRERRWVILGLAQYRQGRQADALATIRRGRELLAAELGLDPCVELAMLEQAILRQDPALQSAAAFRAASAECPYFGLPSAGVEDGERYFGREEELDRALQDLDRNAVLIVSGSSGVGKSSFVRAGIAAHVAVHGGRVTVVTPGEHPLEMLRDLAGRDPDSLLIVDQCEQAFAIDDPEETRRFFEELGRLVFQGPLVVAIRADRLGDLADHHGFAGLIQAHLQMLAPLAGEGLRTVIEEPAKQAGLILEPGLVEILVRDADGRSLPLLSHALRQVWHRREGRVLSVDGYRASGEIEGAVAQTAEEVFGALTGEGRRQARDILLRLVEPSRGGGMICQRVDRASVAVDDAHARVVRRLVDARLVTSDQESYQLAHEAVAREWPRLREWLADDVEGQRIMRHVNSSADAWNAMGRPDSELYRGARLSTTAQWRESAEPMLSAVEAAFLDASLEREAADLDSTRRQLQRERRAVRRLRTLVGVTASLAVVALLTGTVAVVQGTAAIEQAVMEDARRVSALAAAEPIYERALLMAAQAIQLSDAPSTRRALLDVMGRSPRIEGVTRMGGEAGIQQMSIEPGSSLAVAVEAKGGVRVIDYERRIEVYDWRVDGKYVLDAVEAPDGRFVISHGEDGCDRSEWCATTMLHLEDPDDPGGSEQILTGFDSAVVDVEFSPDRSLGAVIAVLPWADEPGNIAIWPVSAPGELMRLDLPHAGTNPGAPNWEGAWGRVRFSPDGSRLYASGFGPTAIFDTRSGALVGELAGDGILAVSPDGGSVIVREGRTAVRVIRLDQPRDPYLLQMPSIVVDATFSPNGQEVITTAGNRVWLWSMKTGDLLESLEGHTDTVTSAVYRSSRQLVTAGRDGAVITWAMGDWSDSFRESRSQGKEFMLERDERTLLIDHPDGTFVGIEADPDTWLERACAIAGRSLTEEEWREVFDERPYDPVCSDGAPEASQ